MLGGGGDGCLAGSRRLFRGAGPQEWREAPGGHHGGAPDQHHRQRRRGPDRGRRPGAGGVNSHTFEPPPSASRSFANADVIFINGLKLEDPTRELADRTKRSDVSVVELGTSALPESDYIFDFSFPKEDGKPNPHLWTDPTYAVKYAEKVRDVLTELDPDGATVYRESTATFVAQANALTEAIRPTRSRSPPTSASC
ncbi:metal ABC transporter substrate-binding protein [Micromonospora sp. M12]